jgi:hypothetical protein
MKGLDNSANYIEGYHKSWQRIRQDQKIAGYKEDERENMNVYSSYEINLRSLE